MRKEPQGVAVTYNGHEYLVCGTVVFTYRRRGDKSWWQRLYSRGPTAVAVREQLNQKDK